MEPICLIEERPYEFPVNEPDNGSLIRPIFQGGCYQNPACFTTWSQPGFMTLLKWKTVAKATKSIYPTHPNENEAKQHLKVCKPSFGSGKDGDMFVTWLGHASVLVEIDSAAFITDPFFSQHCAPPMMQKIGTSSSFGSYLAGNFSRYVPAPCTVQDLPDSLRFVLISHNHYDHLDNQSCIDLANKFGDRLIWCIPKGLRSTLESILPPFCHEKSIFEFEWWQGRSFQLSNQTTYNIVATPCQHWSFRSMTDRNKSLWCSWAFISPSSGKRFFYAGDTGYNDVSFKQIGRVLGPFDLCALPIGAFEPREIMSPQHVSPNESVKIHEDVQSKLSVGVHWGTFAMADEGFMEPEVQLLKLVGFRGDEKAFELKDSVSLTEMVRNANLDLSFTTVNCGQTYQV